MIAAAVVGYLVGSIPFAWLVARWWGGIDIRLHGSGNPGATNVGRVLGRGPGLAALALDILKGWAPTAWALGEGGAAGEAAGVAAAVGALAGHAWPVFLGLRGGKGVATGAGAFLALAPVEFRWAAVAFAAVFVPTFVVSAASLAAAATLAAAVLLRRGLEPTPVSVAAVAVAAVVVARHAPNIRRLVEGTEAPLGRARPDRTGAPPSRAPLCALLAWLVVLAGAVAWRLVP